MNEYRKSIPLDASTDYWFVEMGAIPDKPKWHQELYAFQSYPFPSEAAAASFAAVHLDIEPARQIAIRYPDGSHATVPIQGE